MKRTCFYAFAAIFSLAFGLNASAQLDEREPGIYTIVNGESVPLEFTAGTTSVKTTNILGFETGNSNCTYRGETSGTPASNTFVMVIDPEKKAVVKTLKKYQVFIKSMTPNNMLVIPLEISKGKRVYEEGKTVMGIKTEVKGRMDFSWEQITDNSFEITVDGLVPGEYGIIFRATLLADYDYSAIFGFTVTEDGPAPVEAEAPAEAEADPEADPEA